MSAKSNVPWSVKGIDQDARSVAKELARRRGMTLGEFITEMIREKGLDESDPGKAEDQGTVVSGVTTDQLRGVVDTLNRLNDRLKAAESHLQLNHLHSKETAEGLNKGLETVFERVKRLEKEARGEPSPDIAERLDKLEGAAEKNSWVKSLVALEKALSTLVEQVESSREDHDERLTRNEDLITSLQEKLQADDDAMRDELSGLFDAIDKTTARLADTDSKVQEALEAAREAAESRDETFIERTSQRLQLLGSEIKRTSDQIRGLEGQVSRLSDKIEAGEERSAEGISRVAQSLDTLRREVEERSLTHGEDAPTRRVRSAIEDAEERVGRLQGAYAAVVDRLAGHDPQPDIRPAAPLEASPFPDDALTDDFLSADDQDPEDEFDRIFDDPLNLTSTAPPSAPTAEPQRPETARTEEPARFDPFAERRVVEETPNITEPLFEAERPADPAPREPRPSPEEQGPIGAFDPFPEEREDEWQVPPSLDNPFEESSPDPMGFDGDSPFTDHRQSLGEKTANLLRRAVGTPMDNNPALGWLLIALVLAAIGFTALRLSTPMPERPMVMDPMTGPAAASPAEVPSEEPRVAEASPARPDAGALYVEAKTALASASTPEETAAAVRVMTLAAEAGSSLAQYDLGDLYLTGRGVEQNGLLARAWFEQAADANHVQAINQLGFLDASGIGGPRDYDQAIAQFERAANAGYVNAMVNLGRLFDVEEGYLPYERREASEAYFWFRLAGQRGDAEGAEQAARIEDTLSASEIAAVEARLGNWQQQGL